jgi:hypothetical protein
MARRKIPPGPVAPPVPLDVQAAHEREVSDLYATIASVTGERDAARAENERLKAIIEARDEADGAPYHCGRCDGACNDLYGSGPDAMCRRCYSAQRDADEVVRLRGEVERLTARERRRPFVEQGDVDPDGDVRCFGAATTSRRHGAEMPHAPDCAGA